MNTGGGSSHPNMPPTLLPTAGDEPPNGAYNVMTAAPGGRTIEKENTMAKVYLSPSNHGVDQNKCLKDGCYEDKHTRPIADACARYLKSSGVSVKIGSASRNMACKVRRIRQLRSRSLCAYPHKRRVR